MPCRRRHAAATRAHMRDQFSDAGLRLRGTLFSLRRRADIATAPTTLYPLLLACSTVTSFSSMILSARRSLNYAVGHHQSRKVRAGAHRRQKYAIRTGVSSLRPPPRTEKASAIDC